MAQYGSFVAVGDSFTEGLDDPRPDGIGYRGWADLVAGCLATGCPDFRYANLAVRGRLFDNIVAEQVPLAVAMKPDLISFAGGGNDAMRRTFEHDTLIARFDRTIEKLRATGADVVMFRWADLSGRMPGGKMLRPRVDLLNNAIEDVGRKHGAHVVSLWDDPEFANPRLWGIDRLHLSPAGHRRVAAHVLTELGVACDPDWLAAPPPPEELSWMSRKAADAKWATQHLAPWVKRRLTGKSSGDRVTAKRPELAPLNE
ncbi:SGNH/GDSL hydrolase family protein [Dactylosporangium matsuzakiense]|uniref:SGNH hydrolase n=1 Tax=Dactylosporangium matsuzakiense TaxID=53360 RepID=A0A9W6KE57_9ACTN|nr:SGNH/GDSL hydrolase family protein [Dactylosporangium matsuzakiense]UWZ45018.1 SGNH/GDSL hydrolase family protein [Dactylosporangium matsuzakiense]GLK99058.1 SGNH hydrolase [Dactylosporangium matsuzakiense]